ncbi:1152_t:CDS:1 [Funneliformis mosseae]|uniref:1152_t:CDS:1 n=1 Tax=Funneliformis mosseae TaxID=27381 RepID=A0A9N9H9P6_FUNMO|nr:1152_t:CDS:1 [Funneliformis mosseae]
MSWNDKVRMLVNRMGNRWAISPNSDIFPPGQQIHKECLKNLENIIYNLNGIYTNELLEETQKKQEELARIAREKQEKRQREYDEIKRKEGKAIAEAEYSKKKAEDDEIARIENEKQLKILENKLSELQKKLDDTSSSSGGCFWLETRVKLETGRIIRMSELQVGDRVLSNIRNGIEEFSDVYLIAHIGKLDYEEKFTKISFTKPNGYKGLF